MPSLKLTKTAVETAKPEKRDHELRDTALAGFLCKVTPAWECAPGSEWTDWAICIDPRCRASGGWKP